MPEFSSLIQKVQLHPRKLPQPDMIRRSRTHLDKVLAILEGKKRQENFDINESEFEMIKAMLEESVATEAAV